MFCARTHNFRKADAAKKLQILQSLEAEDPEQALDYLLVIKFAECFTYCFTKKLTDAYGANGYTTTKGTNVN